MSKAEEAGRPHNVNMQRDKRMWRGGKRDKLLRQEEKQPNICLSIESVSAATKCFTIYFPKQAQPHGTQAGLPGGNVPPAQAPRLAPGLPAWHRTTGKGWGGDAPRGTRGSPNTWPGGWQWDHFCARLEEVEGVGGFLQLCLQSVHPRFRQV